MAQEEVIPFAPTSNDVVFSHQSKWRTTHPGNLYYLSLVKEKEAMLQARTEPPTKEEFTDIIEEVLDAVIQRDGRFLRPTDESEQLCVVLTPPVVRNRVRSALWQPSPTTKRKIRKANVLTLAKKGRKKTHTKPAKRVIVGGEDEDDELAFAQTITPSQSSHGAGFVNSGRRTASVINYSPSASPPRHGSLDNHPTRRAHDNAFPITVGRNGGNSNNDFVADDILYGSRQDEVRLRRWLNDHMLPQLVAETLLTHGVRCVEDVLLLMESQPNPVLQELPFLDLVKLERAVEGERHH